MILERDKRTWILIADGESARIYFLHPQPLGVASEPIARFDHKHAGEHAGAAGPKSSRTGDSHEPHSVPPHAVDRHSDQHRLEQEQFAASVADAINFAATEREFNNLIVVAPPKTMGDLRNSFDSGLRHRIILEIKGDWVKMTPPEITSHLRPFVSPVAGP